MVAGSAALAIFALAGLALRIAGCRAGVAHLQASSEHAFIERLFGSEEVIAVLRHPLGASVWRLRGAGAAAVALGPRQHQELVRLLTDPRSFDRAVVATGTPDLAVRCEDEHGSLTMVFAFDRAVMELRWNGNRVSQGSFTPARGALLA